MANKNSQRKAPCELRHDPTSGNWALVFRKPEDNQQDPKRRYKSLNDLIRRTTRREFDEVSCVWARQFCGGKRQEKEPLFGLRWSSDGKYVEVTYDNWHSDDWEVMVVRTDYAQVVPTKDSPLLEEDTFLAEAGAGVHDLIIDDSTEAHEPLGIMGTKRTQLVLMAMLYRLSGAIKGFPELDQLKTGMPLNRETFIRHVAFFHNHRRESGGSLEHPHSQSIGSPIIPADVSAELEHARKRLEQPPRQCVYCEIVEAELALRERDKSNCRIVFENVHFLAVVPFAPNYPFEVWILPKRHNSCFSHIQTDPADACGNPTELEDLAALVTTVVCRSYVVLDDPGYNLIVKTQPIPPSDDPNKWAFYHWHIRIQSRGLVTRAGFELSTGTSNLPITPEETAELLRNWGDLHKSRDTDGSLEWHIANAELEAAGNLSKRGAVRKLRNIVKVLEPFAGNLVGFAHARSVVERLAKERPSLLMSPRQLQLPGQPKQLLQPEEHAGGVEGPHYRCCPATGRWVLIPANARRKTVQALKEDREKKRNEAKKRREEKAAEKAAAQAMRLSRQQDVVPRLSEGNSAGAASQREVHAHRSDEHCARGQGACDGTSWVDKALDEAVKNALDDAKKALDDAKKAKDGAMGDSLVDGAHPGWKCVATGILVQQKSELETDKTQKKMFQEASKDLLRALKSERLALAQTEEEAIWKQRAREEAIERVTTRLVASLRFKLGDKSGHDWNRLKFDAVSEVPAAVSDAIESGRCPGIQESSGSEVTMLQDEITKALEKAFDDLGTHNQPMNLDVIQYDLPAVMREKAAGSGTPASERKKRDTSQSSAANGGGAGKSGDDAVAWQSVDDAKWKQVLEQGIAELQEFVHDEESGGASGTKSQDRDEKSGVGECPFCNEQRRKLNIFLELKSSVDRENGRNLDRNRSGERLDEVRDPIKSGVYVIENSNPLFTELHKNPRTWPRIGGTGPFRAIEGFGKCEVVVVHGNESHKTPTKDVLTDMVKTVAARIRRMKESGSRCIRHVSVISNHGPDAGATSNHENWQVIGTPIVPTVIERELDHFHAYAQIYSGRCCYCDMLDAEIREHVEYERERFARNHSESRLHATYKHRSRIIDWDGEGGRICGLRNAEYVALAPYSSRSPLEIWILPANHRAMFGDGWEELEEPVKDPSSAGPGALARLLYRVLTALHNAADNPSYTLVVQQAPVDLPRIEGQVDRFHWRIVIEPQKLNIPAGYEHLTGIWSNILPPEDAADALADQIEKLPKETVGGACRA